MYTLNATLNELGFDLTVDEEINGMQLRYITSNGTKYYFYIDDVKRKSDVIYSLLEWSKEYDAIDMLKDECAFDMVCGLKTCSLFDEIMSEHYMELVEVEEKMKDLHQRLLEDIL